MTRGRIADATTLLFVPGDRPDRFERAAGSGADVVVLDLEDAVAASSKGAARTEVVRWVSSGGRAAVRVSAVGEAAHEEDVTALQALIVGDRQAGLVGVVVPKAQDPAELARLAAALPGVPLLALVETAAGVLDARSVATAEGVVRLAVGHLDLAADLGADPDDAVVHHARHQLVLAARAAGSPAPVDGVSTQVRDVAAVEADALRARRGGMGGKLCIHPDQVEVVRQAFAPTAEEMAWARLVLGGGDGVDVVDGQMVDRPVLLRAQALLARSESAS